MKILIGYDGSESANLALEDLPLAGLPENVGAVVMTVGEAWEFPIVADRVTLSTAGFVLPMGTAVGQHLSEVKKQAQITASAAARKVKDIFPEWKVTAVSATGKSAFELIKKADEWSPDLIVVGSQGRSTIGRFFLGSVSQKVLNESNCSVRISKKGGSGEHSELRILLAVDGSENAEKAVREVAGRLWKPGTEFRLIAVNDPFIHNELGFIAWNFDKNQPEKSQKSEEWIEKTVKTPASILQSAGLTVAEAIGWGDAGNIILHEAKEWGADTIFLGARGLTRFKRFLLGSVSSFVALRAECSVEIVR